VSLLVLSPRSLLSRLASAGRARVGVRPLADCDIDQETIARASAQSRPLADAQIGSAADPSLLTCDRAKPTTPSFIVLPRRPANLVLDLSLIGLRNWIVVRLS